MAFPDHTPLTLKSLQPSARSMGECSYDLPQGISSVNRNPNPLFSNDHSINTSETSADKVSSSTSVDHSWESEDNSGCLSPEYSREVHNKMHHLIRQSGGKVVDNEGRVPSHKDTDETDQGFSCDDSQEMNYEKVFNAHDHNARMERFDSNELRDYLLNQDGEALVGGQMHNETILSVRGQKNLETEGYKQSSTLLSGEGPHEFVDCTIATPQTFLKSSLHDMGIVSSTPGGCSQSHGESRRNSSEDMSSLDAKGKGLLIQEDGLLVMDDEEGGSNIFKSERDKSENPSEEFKIKRIEEWISMIDLENCTPLLDTVESSRSTGKLKKVVSMSGVTVAMLDGKTTTGMEAAKNYVSSLTSTSTSAQLANHGLVVIPVLSAFVQLRVLNLSGNSIERINARSFPRGLHMLDLSKNNISTIEGLRELTRLRVLDLSYNRISRIGHGLASCSSLKEVYLACNKISDVEGLHRLLKLNILDLSFNKISTAKCLDQLAANYNSLHTISLEGNPAQRNVGDEQVKKYVQGLLPYLVYYNKQPIKTKEVCDRTARSTLTSTHQFDRSFKLDHNKLVRRGRYNHTASHRQSSYAATHSRPVGSPKSGKGRRERIPSTGSKRTHHRNHHFDLSSNLVKLRSHLSMH